MINQYIAKITDFTQADYTNTYSLLECAIREKIDGKKHPKARQQSLAGYFLLFRAVNELFFKKEIKIYFNENGKPLCDFCHFNISHSNEMVICVVSDEPIGVDIQQIKPVKQRHKYLGFNQKESDYVNQNADLISQRYTEIFTKKEAAIKMLGAAFKNAAQIDTFSKEYAFETEKKGEFFVTVCTKNRSQL